ncbi:MAG: alpha/beta hydrolase [Kofleriaceae bacterium]
MTEPSDPSDPTSRRIALPTGLTYHLLEWNRAGRSNVTFVLVHGFLDFAYGWHEVAPRLAAEANAHVVAVDVRGHGDSDWIGAGGYYHYLDYVADLDAVIERVANDQLVVVGHSMGGGIVSYWAGARPQRARAIALLEGLGPPDQSAVELGARTAQWIDAWRTARVAFKPIATRELAAARLRKHDALLGEALALRLATHGTRPVAGGFVWKHDPLHLPMGPHPFRREAAAQYWKRIACPVLIVDGARSTLNLSDAERAERRGHFAQARHVVLPEAGHMMARHQPIELATLLAELAR